MIDERIITYRGKRLDAMTREELLVVAEELARQQIKQLEDNVKRWSRN